MVVWSERGGNNTHFSAKEGCGLGDRVLYDSRERLNQIYTMELGREVNAGLPFLEWAIDHELLLEGEALSALCYTALKDPRRGTTCLTPALRRWPEYVRRGRYFGDTTCRTHEKNPLSGDVHHHNKPVRATGYAWIMLELVGARRNVDGDPVLKRDDNNVAVSRVTRCGGARDKRTRLHIRMFGIP